MTDERVPPAEGLALDEALFLDLDADRGGETLRIWEAAHPAVIVGAFGGIAREVRQEACVRDGVPVLRRCSGGGAVVVGPGCLNYTLVLSLERRPELQQVGASYEIILGRIRASLDVPGLTIAGPGDLAVGRQKVGGSAQRRGRRALLHHGTLLYAFEIGALERYLCPPPREPAYRAGRTHGAFVTTLPLPRDRIAGALVSAWGAAGAWQARRRSGAVREDLA